MITTGSGAEARAPRRSWLLPADVVAAAVAVPMELVVAPVVTGTARPSPTAAVLIVFTWVAVTTRSRAPRAALVLTVLGAVAVTLLQGERTLAIAAALLALYSVAVTGSRRATLVAWAGTAGALAGAGALASGGEAIDLEFLSALPWTAVVATLGSALRNRRAYLTAVEERAERAERGREEEARRRVAEERVRIARDLHDVVAHHIAVISVQAGVAQHLLATRPADAGAALAHVRRAAADVLGELGDVLSVLRQPGELAGADNAPAPGLARLDDLVGSFTAAGLHLEWSTEGEPRELQATVDLVAYRVLEEALTNALKHGSGTTRLTTAWTAESLVLRVVNDLPVPVHAGGQPRHGHAGPPHGRSPEPLAHPPSERTGTGHGLLGMSERATAVGGQVRSGRTSDGRFTVEAVLPVRAGAGADLGAPAGSVA